MQSNPLISIIVPVYNTEEYIHRCIDSILAQAYSNFELLLIDDGTPDRAGKICDEYALRDTRIKVLHKENGGVSSARNLGLDIAVGDWIAFADSDDWVKKDWLADYVIEIERNSGVGLVFQGFSISENGVESIEHSIENRVFQREELLDAYVYLERKVKIFGYTWSKIYRAEVFKNNDLKFDQTLSFSEDLELTLRFLQKIDSISLINKFNYVYTLDSDISLSRRSHSYDIFMYLANMTNDQLKMLSNRTGCVCDDMFEAVTHYRFRALKSLYRPHKTKSLIERCGIIDVYCKQYYGELKSANIYSGREKLFVNILALKSARLIDLIFQVVFKLI